MSESRSTSDEYFQSVRECRDNAKLNVVLILVDCLRARNVFSYGNETPDAPQLERLMKQGFACRKVFVQAPHTQPSTASIFASLYPSVHRVNTPENRFDPRIIRLGSIFSEAGYETAAFVANPHINPRSGHLDGIASFSDGRNRLKKWSWHLSRWGEDSRVLNRAFFRWFRQRDRTKPFFCFLFYIDVHNPYTSLPNVFHRFLPRKLHYPDFSRYQYSDEEMERLHNLYRKRIRKVDSRIAQLVAFLKNQGEWDRTLFMVTADHGEGLDRREGHGFHGGLYEKGIHVPLILLAPWLGQPARTLDPLIASIDIAPTMLDLIGLPRAPQFQGRSFAPLLRNGAYEAAKFVAGEYNHERYIRTERWKYINKTVGILGPNPLWMKEKNPIDFEEVYDLDIDPDEDRNVVREVDPRTLEELRHSYDDFTQQLSSDRFASETYDLDEEVRQRLRGLGYID